MHEPKPDQLQTHHDDASRVVSGHYLRRKLLHNCTGCGIITVAVGRVQAHELQLALRSDSLRLATAQCTHLCESADRTFTALSAWLR